MRSATAPPEARGLERDEIGLVVATPDGPATTTFRALPAWLRPGDLVVVNTSATLAAALDGTLRGRDVVVHVSSRQDDGTWVIEIRPPGAATGPVEDVQPGDTVDVHGVTLTVLGPLPGQLRFQRVVASHDLGQLMAAQGRPVRYAYVPDAWPLSTYQTVFARDPGSAEMPSAGRPFSHRLVTELVTRGVLLAPVTLHAGLSSQEPGEPPQPERFAVPPGTAALVNHVRRQAGRIVAVGTTVARALESVASPDGNVQAGDGWTDLVLGPRRPARTVTGLVTGWHGPGTSHLQLLEAVAGPALVAAAYDAAARTGMLWHEFGDSCLLLP